MDTIDRELVEVRQHACAARGGADGRGEATNGGTLVAIESSGSP